MNLNFSAASMIFRNEQAWNKLTHLMREMSILYSLIQKDKNLSFSDMKQYGFDPNTIDLIFDEDIKEYFLADKKIHWKLLYSGKYDEVLDLLSEYQEYMKAFQ